MTFGVVWVVVSALVFGWLADRERARRDARLAEPWTVPALVPWPMVVLGTEERYAVAMVALTVGFVVVLALALARAASRADEQPPRWVQEGRRRRRGRSVAAKSGPNLTREEETHDHR